MKNYKSSDRGNCEYLEKNYQLPNRNLNYHKILHIFLVIYSISSLL